MHKFLKFLTAWILAAIWFVQPVFAGAYGSVYNTDSYKGTFTASSTFTTLAASATDFFTIYGSGTKTIRVLKVYLTNLSTGTAAVNDVVSVIKRSTAPSGGTATTITACPLDSTNAAVTATVKIWTANPTPGTAVGTIATYQINGYLTGGSSSTNIPNFPKYCLFDADKFGQACVLRGTGEGLCLNLGGVTQAGTSPKIDIEVVWTEE
jgi:hypothetical protein